MISRPIGLYCNFDAGSLCSGVEQRGDDKFDWTVKRGSTPSGGTGPSGDVKGSGTLSEYYDSNTGSGGIHYNRTRRDHSKTS